MPALTPDSGVLATRPCASARALLLAWRLRLSCCHAARPRLEYACCPTCVSTHMDSLSASGA
eukprot:13696212-Alexandrium_andersonii.AAC.1